MRSRSLRRGLLIGLLALPLLLLGAYHVDRSGDVQCVRGRVVQVAEGQEFQQSEMGRRVRKLVHVRISIADSTFWWSEVPAAVGDEVWVVYARGRLSGYFYPRRVTGPGVRSAPCAGAVGERP